MEGIGLSIVCPIYRLAAYAFKIFLILANGKILSDDAYTKLVSNFYIVIGVVMLFAIAFALLKAMINPDDSKGGTSTAANTLKNFVISVLTIILLPFIFNFMFDVQTAIISNNTIGKFFGYGGNSENEESFDVITVSSYKMANGVFTAFLTINPEVCDINDSDAAVDEDDIRDCEDSIESSKGDTFTETKAAVDLTGKFNLYRNFKNSVKNGEIEHNFLVNILAGLGLLYIAISFCFDMAVRTIKLIFCQLIAPIPIFMRVVPTKKQTFDDWVKLTLTCYLEVFVRILAFYFCVYGCTMVLESEFLRGLSSYGFGTNLIAKAFMIMGIIIFMKQLPKLISTVTGLDSGNMKLGIKEKLANGGGFAVGAAVGASATNLVRTGLKTAGNVKNKWQSTQGKPVGKRVFSAGKSLAGGIATTAGQGVGGLYSGLMAGKSAKSFKDMKSSAATGAAQAEGRKDKRNQYKASHGGTLGGVIEGKFQDAGRAVKEWAGSEVSDAEAGFFQKAASTSKGYNDDIEKTYKTKAEYVELNNKVKELKSLVDTGNTSYLTELNEKKAALENMQVEMSYKKVSAVKSAAYQLAVDHKAKYSGIEVLDKAYKTALYKGFDIDSSIAFSENRNANGDIVSYNYQDTSGNTQVMDINTFNVFNGMLNGTEFSADDITKENIARVEDAVDKINIERTKIASEMADKAFKQKVEKEKAEGK